MSDFTVLGDTGWSVQWDASATRMKRDGGQPILISGSVQLPYDECLALAIYFDRNWDMGRRQGVVEGKAQLRAEVAGLLGITGLTDKVAEVSTRLGQLHDQLERASSRV